MSLLELEYAVLGPERWVCAIAKAHSQNLTLLPTYKTHKPFRPPGYFSALCSQIFLIPGGRYLLTLCREVVAIWDLLDASKSPTEPLATISGSCRYFTAYPTSDGLGIRVCVTKYSGNSPTSAWDVRYEIHSFIFAEENPAFNKIGGFAVRKTSDNYFTSICGDRLIVVDGPMVKVWNFVTDEWAAWLTVFFPHKVIVSGDIVVLIGRKGISMWDIPPLHPNAQAFFAEPYSTMSVLPRLSIIYSDFQNPDFFREFECTGTCDWYAGTVHSLWFDLLVKAQGARLSPFNRYEIQFAHDDPPSSTLRPTRKYYLPIPFESSYSPYRVCGDKTFMWWSTDSAIECSIGPTSGEDADHEDYRISLLEAMDGGRRQATVCPVSGRLCYVCHDTNSIKIVDFLAPPSTSFNDA
ncbi:hypothetical protein BYT27DRAFT_7119639 [Phlegmacium glaucopus]|nr:hypothetical protein BYT27DRAFT_7119639 [Phlegmacium glaucopus]